MPWTASVVSALKDPGMTTVVVRFADGTRTFDETFKDTGPANMAWLRRMVTFRLKALEAQDSFSPAIGGQVPPFPDDQQDSGLDGFKAKVEKFKRIWDNLVLTEIVPKNNAQIVAMQNSIKADLAAYFDRF